MGRHYDYPIEPLFDLYCSRSLVENLDVLHLGTYHNLTELAIAVQEGGNTRPGDGLPGADVPCHESCVNVRDPLADDLGFTCKVEDVFVIGIRGVTAGTLRDAEHLSNGDRDIEYFRQITDWVESSLLQEDVDSLGWLVSQLPLGSRIVMIDGYSSMSNEFDRIYNLALIADLSEGREYRGIKCRCIITDLMIRLQARVDALELSAYRDFVPLTLGCMSRSHPLDEGCPICQPRWEEE